VERLVRGTAREVAMYLRAIGSSAASALGDGVADSGEEDVRHTSTSLLDTR
jgi:hypothetical protein